MKKIGFLSFGHWSHGGGSRVRSASDSLLQAVELAQAAEEIGIDGAYFRIHHFAEQQSSPFPLLATIAARTTTLEFGTGVIDMRYENPLYLAEEAAALDLLSAGRLQLGVSRGSPGHAEAGYAEFGYLPAVADGQTDTDMAREKTARFLSAIHGEAFASPNPILGGDLTRRLPISPLSAGLPERIWWGAGNLDTAVWAARQGLHLMSSTVIMDERGMPFEELQLQQLDGFRQEWEAAGWDYAPQTSVSRSIVPLVDDLSRAYFGAGQHGEGIGEVGGITSRFGRSYAADPEVLVDQLGADVALASADMVLITIPNQLGVEFNAKLLAGIKAVGDELGWSEPVSTVSTLSSGRAPV